MDYFLQNAPLLSFSCSKQGSEPNVLPTGFKFATKTNNRLSEVSDRLLQTYKTLSNAFDNVLLTCKTFSKVFDNVLYACKSFSKAFDKLL